VLQVVPPTGQPSSFSHRTVQWLVGRQIPSGWPSAVPQSSSKLQIEVSTAARIAAQVVTLLGRQ
jgi:hypothetical protein